MLPIMIIKDVVKAPVLHVPAREENRPYLLTPSGRDDDPHGQTARRQMLLRPVRRESGFFDQNTEGHIDHAGEIAFAVTILVDEHPTFGRDGPQMFGSGSLK